MGLFKFLLNHDPKVIKHTYKVVGYSQHCKYKKNGISERQDALLKSRINDRIHLKQYTYKGNPAFCVMSDNLECDIGVIPYYDVKSVIRTFGERSCATGYISNVYHIDGNEYDDGTYKTFIACDIVLEEDR